MRFNIKKTFTSILMATVISLSASPVLANNITVNMPHTIYETKDYNHLSSGVVHEKILKFTTAGWWNLNVLRVDLSDPYTNLGGLISSNGLSTREKTSSMVEQSKAIAGINGDFFDFAPLPSAMGSLIDKGEVLLSPIERAYAAPSFFIDELNQAAIDYLDRSMSVTNKRTGKISHIYTLNKTSPTFENITLLNKHWGSKSVGNRFHNDLIEIVVDKGIVQDVRIGKEAVPIPESGYILAVRGVKHQGLANYGIGDELDLKIATSPSIEGLQFAIGGGSIILKDGELASTNINIRGNQPRTGIGISKDGKEVILVTIDGRDSSFKGVSQEIFGAILRSLGAHNGLNLDGGGSTTMAIRPVNESKAQVVNRPSDGGERAVINGVGVFSNAPLGELSYIKLSTDDSNMFIDTTRKFTAKGFDQNHNPIPLDQSKLVFTHSGVEGSIEGHTFKAASSGKATISAQYDDISATIDLNVLGRVKHISSNLDNFNIDLNSERRLGAFTARDENGYTAKVDARDLTYSTVNDIGYVEAGVFYSGSSSLAGVLTAGLGDGLTNIVVSVGSNPTLVEGFENLEGFKFTSYPEGLAGGISLSQDAKEGSSSLALKYDFSNIEADTRAGYLNLNLPLPAAPRKLGLWAKGDNNASWLRGHIKDSKGNTHTIDFVKSIDFSDWRYLTTDIPSNISYPITLERIYVVETNPQKKHSGEILIDGLTASYPPTIGTVKLPTPSSLRDEKNKASSIGQAGFSIGVTAEPKGLNSIVNYDASAKVKEKINKHRIAALLGGASGEFTRGLTNNARINTNNVYSKTAHHDVAFINLNTAKNGIMATDIYQWNKLKADLKDLGHNNIILFSSSPIFGSGGFTDKLEADLLHTHLVQAKERGKNIFLVHGGSSNTSDLRDGVRYIGLNTRQVSKPEDIYNLSMVEFIVNGSDVTYQINPLFPKPQVKTN